MSSDVMVHETLPPDARSVGEARSAVRAVLAGAGDQVNQVDRDDWSDRATLAVSELVTNALVHGGTAVELRIWLRAGSLRVEIADGNPHVPTARSHGLTAATGRGLHLVESSVDRWAVEARGEGKAVWFEIGDPSSVAATDQVQAAGHQEVEVVLLHMPLLLHSAWQEQISALLREYLLVRLEDDPDVLDRHVQASDALGLLFDQVPPSQVDEHPDTSLVGAIEPHVSAERVVLTIPRDSVGHFDTLEQLIVDALDLAHAGELLAYPTQPEIAAMRHWLCGQVRSQAAGTAGPVPFEVRSDVSALSPVDRIPAALRALADSDEALLAADDHNRIVAVTRPVLEVLGYADEAELLGRRVLVVIPQRFHQAHIAGMALHHTNGRDAILDTRITVPVLRADGTEISLAVTIEPELVEGSLRVYVARFG